MNLGRLLSLALILCVFMTDCSKDSDVAPTKKCYLDSIKVSGQFTYVSTYSYRTDNKLVSGTFSRNSSLFLSSYTYDQKGRLISVESDRYTDHNEYDNQNRLVQSIREGVSKEVYLYNSTGQVSKLEGHIYNSGSSTYSLYYYQIFTYSSTTSRNPATVMQYDAFGNWSHTTVYEYDSNINPFTIIIDSNNTLPTNNLTKLTLTQPTATTTLIQTYSYTYNSEGYPLTQTMLFPGGTQSTTYSYNCR